MNNLSRYSKSKKSLARNIDSLPKSLTLVLDLYGKNIHFLIAWITLLLGGIFLIFHFLYIAHFPAFDLTSSIALLAVISLTGGMLILFLSMVLVVPLIFWTMFIESEYGKKTVNELKRCKRKQDTGLWELGFLFFAPITITLILFVVLAVAVFYSPQISEGQIFWAVSFIYVSILFSGWLIYDQLKRRAGFPKLGIWGSLVYQLVLISSFTMYLMTPFLIHIFYLSKYNSDTASKKDGWSLLGAILLASVICLFFNAVLFVRSATDEKRRSSGYEITRQFSFGFLLLFMILLLSNSMFSIPQMILRMYGLADTEHVKVSFSKEGCPLLRQFNIQYVNDKESGNCVINHSTILSSIGAEFFIKTQDGKRLAVPKSITKVMELPSTPIRTRLIETVDENSNLKKLSLKIENFGKQIDQLSAILIFIDEQGNVLKKNVLVKNVSLLQGHYLIDENIALTEDIRTGKNIWCDVEIFVNGKQHWYKLVKDITFE